MIKLGQFAGLVLALKASLSFAGLSEIRSETERLLHHPNAQMNAIALDHLGLSEGTTPTQPWTSSYWPDAIGGIATRYGKRSVFSSQLGVLLNYNWTKSEWENSNYRMKKKALELTEEEIAENLAPSEKYDLLMGDLKFTLTNNIVAEIDYRYHHKLNPKTGIWELGDGMMTWVGICDGWTSASLHTPRPVNKIKVRGLTGQIITFYPDDLKALASHLFARTNQWLGIERVGDRCDARRNQLDRFGLPTGKGCNDISPAIWHATVVNRIGIDKTGLIIDINNDYRVDNHPVFHYDIQYFNPSTGAYGQAVDSQAPVAQVDDGLQSVRSPEAVTVLGVRMHIKMGKFDWPTGAETDSEAQDQFREETYYYDLELDAEGNIVGGQWHRNRKKFLFFGSSALGQPDMLWMLAPNQLAWSYNSFKVDEGSVINPNNPYIWGNINWRYHGDGNIPADWIATHYEDASYFKWPEGEPFAMIPSSHPLAEMVYYLMDQARQR